MKNVKPQVAIDDFERIDLRVGAVVHAEPNQGARKPAFVLRIDFGELGVLESSAQITQNHSVESLIGMQVVAVVNFPAKLVAGVKSQCLVLGALSESDGVVCLTTAKTVENGSRVA